MELLVRSDFTLGSFGEEYTVPATYKKLVGAWDFPYMRVFLYPSLLNKEDVWPGT
jgi:hypothetical protein